MRFIICCLLLLSTVWQAGAVSYSDSITAYRKQYIAELLADKRSPIKHAQVKNISFFPPDHSYCAWGSVTLTPGSVPFLVPTHSGKQKPFREYGTITFSIHDSTFTLHMYQSINMLNDAAH